MIYNKFSYEKFEKDFLQKINDFLKNNDLINMPAKKYEIDGDNLFAIINDYETTTFEDRVWEAHRKYIDVHVMLKGKEKLGIAFIEDANISKYHEEQDYVEIPSVNSDISYITLRQGEYLVCYPSDVHKTALIVDEKQSVRKIIFKVKLDN